MARVAVVSTMGKVGSSASAQAIRRAGLECHDVHSLNQRTLMTWARSYLERDEFPPTHVCSAMGEYELLRNTERCHYITGVREPISRNLSAYFQNLDLYDNSG